MASSRIVRPVTEGEAREYFRHRFPGTARFDSDDTTLYIESNEMVDLGDFRLLHMEIGWYIQNYKSLNGTNTACIKKVRPTQVRKSLFHFTQEGNVDSILNSGLNPSRGMNYAGDDFGNFNYPPRNCFFRRKSYGRRVSQAYALEVHPDRIPDVLFFRDLFAVAMTPSGKSRDWDTAVWTHEIIPPEAISIVGTKPVPELSRKALAAMEEIIAIADRRRGRKGL